MISIRCVDQRYRDEVMGEHLPMILAAFLNVDDNDLLQPE
jgi:hypothetical protein